MNVKDKANDNKKGEKAMSETTYYVKVESVHLETGKVLVKNLGSFPFEHMAYKVLEAYIQEMDAKKLFVFCLLNNI